MIRSFLLLLLIILGQIGLGQSRILVLVAITKTPIPNVHLIQYASDDPEMIELKAVSDQRGLITLQALSGSNQELIFTHVSYESKPFSFESAKNGEKDTVYLKERFTQIPSFVVNGENEFFEDDFVLISKRYVELNGPHLVNQFWIQRNEVTVGQYRQFVAESGYITDAEKGAMSVKILKPVFNSRKYQRRFDKMEEESFQKASRYRFQGWERQFTLVDTDTVNWRHDEFGRLRTSDHYPVIHISYNDAMAYATWYDLDLPTVTEWIAITEEGLQLGWRRSNSTGVIRKIDLSPSDTQGLNDVFGNVSEYLELTEINGIKSITATPLNTFVRLQRQPYFYYRTL